MKCPYDKYCIDNQCNQDQRVHIMASSPRCHKAWVICVIGNHNFRCVITKKIQARIQEIDPNFIRSKTSYKQSITILLHLNTSLTVINTKVNRRGSPQPIPEYNWNLRSLFVVCDVGLIDLKVNLSCVPKGDNNTYLLLLNLLMV